MALTYGPSFCRMLAQRMKSSCVDELIAADHAYLGNCQTEWVDKRPSLMNGKKYIFHFVSSTKKSIFSSAFSPFFFCIEIVYFDWKLAAESEDCEYFLFEYKFQHQKSVRSLTYRKVWDLINIFPYISVSCSFYGSNWKSANGKMAYWNEKWCQFICSIPFLCRHSLTHTHSAIRILPGVFYPGAHLNVIRTQCTALESHIDVNLPLVREWKTLRFWPVNSNKHAIYINFLCHIFIHFGQCGAHLAGLLMWKYKYGHCPCYCFNRIVVLV